MASDHPDCELDAVLDKYSAQAQRDISKVQEGEERVRPSKRLKAGSAERRAEALAQPLPADNKGFQLLTKMGYRPGSDQTQPIPVTLKQDRLGLGRQSAAAARRERDRQREEAAAQQAERARLEGEATLQIQRHSFQQARADQFAARRVQGQLKAAQRSCEDLDRRAGVNGNVMWQEASGQTQQEPEQPNDGDEAAGEGVVVAAERERWEALPAPEQLTQLIAYLRTRYRYCMFCGVQYDDAHDLREHCPGPLEEDH